MESWVSTKLFLWLEQTHTLIDSMGRHFIGWDVWGVPIEENSTVKAKNYKSRYMKSMHIDTTLKSGSYVFLTTQKLAKPKISLWYGVFKNDIKESVDVKQYLWTGQWRNRSPFLSLFCLKMKKQLKVYTLEFLELYNAKVIANWISDVITYSCEILHRKSDLKAIGVTTKINLFPVGWLEKTIDQNGEITFDIPDRGRAIPCFCLYMTTRIMLLQQISHFK